MSLETVAVATPDGTAEQWQKLTAYIVSLEKEVQYYKHLVQDVQAKQQEQGGQGDGDSPSTGMPACPGGGGGAAGSEGGRKVVADYWKEMLQSDPENHVLLLVFAHLSARELCQAARVCRKWYTISRHPLLWRELVMTETVVKPQVNKVAWGGTSAELPSGLHVC